MAKSRLRKMFEEAAQKRLFGYGPTDDWSYVDKFQGPSKDIALLGTYSGLTYRCINTIAEEVGRYQPVFYRQDTSGRKATVATHQFLNVLRNPNPDMSQFQLFEGSSSFVEQFGEFFWYLVPGALTGYNNGIKQIYLLRPDRVGMTIDKDTGEVLGYTMSVGSSGKAIPFTTDEIFHFMQFNPKNPYRGYSTVEAAIDYIQTEEEVSRFTRNYFRNNAAMSGILNVNGKVSKESWQKFVRQWRERYEGVENAGKVALVRDSQIDFTPITSSLADLQLTELKQSTIEQILMMFKIPKGILGMESDQGLGRASVETLEYIFAKRTIDPKLARLDDGIQKIIDKYYAKDKLMVTHENIVPEDKEFMLNVYDRGVDRWLTRKEIRDADPQTANTSIAGSEQLFAPINMVPIGDLSPAEAASASGKAVKTADKVVLKKKVAKSLDFSTAQKEAFRLQLERNAESHSKIYYRDMKKVLEKQEQTVLSNITHLASKALGDDLFDMSDEDQAFQDELMPVLSDLSQAQGQLALEFAGDTNAQYQISKALQAALQASIKKMSQNFNTETLDQLSGTLTEGVSAGESLDKLSARVADVYSAAKDWRTLRVARTESMNAANASAIDAYKQTEYVVAIEWYINPGACDFCQSMAGTQVPLDQPFVASGDSVDTTDGQGNDISYSADYGDVDQPPLHPNCTCGVIPITSMSSN